LLSSSSTSPMSTQLPLEAFPTWARLNNIDFSNVGLERIDGKGFGWVADRDVTSGSQDDNDVAVLLKIPRDLILSLEAVEEYAKIDQNFRQLREVAGGKASITASHLTGPYR
jgi:hypothetical protein